MNGGGSYNLPLTYETGQPNGRINLSAPAGASAITQTIPGFGYQTTSETSFQGDALRGNWEKNALSESFFSSRNVDVIQNGIRKEVFMKSKTKGYVIDTQSVYEIKIIMRSIYLQYARNSPHNVAGQVDELNHRVLEYCVPNILSAVDHYQYYLQDIQSMPVPLARSVHMSRSGTKSVPLGNFL